MKITICTAEVIGTLKTNRKKHIGEHKLQMEGWQKMMEKFSQDLDEWSKSGGDPNQRPKEPHKPESYEKSYDHYIELLEAHILETVQLDNDEFKEIVKNQFTWHRGFLANTALYHG